ncbi:hypothetical protein ACFXK6_001441 [Citrobacter koseri]|uniref:hypothetical protein n=1 Tax=Citrobacter koseri TaxID=545 RepID=UPI0023B055A9|nr:hypothetical protein [Citrobacter koseri]
MRSTVETKIIELVKLGHELAKELHCAESAALVSDLASQLEVQLVRSNALAAENTGVKAKGRELLGEACAVYAKFNKLIDPEIGDFIDGQTLHEFQYVLDCETPATDAFLAEVRAAAVDEVCLKISNAIVNCYQDEQVGLDAAETICGDFAAQLRKGVQS